MAAVESSRLRRVLGLLEQAHGDEHWHWHPEHVAAPIDIIAGAILVQHTTWRNAERALENLRAAGALDAAAWLSLPDDALLGMIRGSGTPTIKLKRLRAIARTIEDAGGVDAFLALARGELRGRLLGTHGIGPETADAIMLYAAHQPVFMVDAYTQRIFTRLGIEPEGTGYDAWQRFFEEQLPDSTARDFQRHHAHIVLHGKAVCRPAPRCDACSLADMCPTAVQQQREALLLD
jgi:endonuclease-3 related protein